MNKRPKSREETPKEGRGNVQSTFPRCSNIASRRTKSKYMRQQY